MKVVRLCLIGVGILAALVFVALGVALNASVQTWAARKALAGQPQLHAKLGAISAGFQQTELHDLQLETRGVVVTLPSLQLELPLVSAGVAKKVSVRRFVAKGWTVDLTHANQVAATLRPMIERALAAAPAAREFSLLTPAFAAEVVAPVFRGVFDGLLLPVDLALDGVDLDGEIILPPFGGHGAERLRLTVQGGGLGIGREGSFVVELSGAKSNGGAVTLNGTLTAKMDTARTFERFGAKIAAEASGPQVPSGVKLHVDASVSRTTAGESYAVRLSGETRPLAELQANLVSATTQVVGSWKLDLRDQDLSPFALGHPLPKFAAQGEGKFETTTAFADVQASGRLNASVAKLAQVVPAAAAVGEMKLAAEFDVLQHGTALRVEKLDASLASDAPVLAVRVLQAFQFDASNGALQVADPASDLVAVTLSGLPLAWARPVLGDLAVTGGDVRGEFLIGAREGGLAIRPKAPLTIARLSAAQAGTPLLRDLDLSVSLSADYTPQGWQVTANDVRAMHAGATLLTLNAKAGQLAGADKSIKATGRWSANLVGLTSQPVVAAQVALTGGVAEGDFTASIDKSHSIEAKLALTKLAVASGEKLPAVSLQLRADVTPDGKVTFKLPLLFEQGTRKSDLLVAGSLTPGQPTPTVEAHITGDQVYVEDVQVLTVLVPSVPETKPAGGTAAAAPAKAAESAKSVAPDAVAFWSGVRGQASLALKKVVYGASFEITDVGGTLQIEPAALKLDGVRAVFGTESDLKLSSAVKFDAAATERYALEANVAVNNFDTAAVFRALDPTKSPTIESRVTLNTHVTGAGVNLNEAVGRAHGDVQVTGKSGVFRALSADVADRVQKTQSAVAVIGGLVGGKYADMANKGQIFSEIAKALAEIPFDQLNVTAVRGDDLNLQLKDFTLISPEVRLTGQGEITHVEGKSVLEQPLNVQLNLGARGKLADLLQRARLLSATQDNLGYTAFVAPIKVGGTLARTDTSELKKTILSSALEKSGLIDSLLGK